MQKYAIGLDFGTLSVRGILLDIQSGEEICQCMFDYPHAVMDASAFKNGKQPVTDAALQHPQDYLDGLSYVVAALLLRADGIDARQIVGLGVDFTASTVLPVSDDGTPLCFFPEFKNEPHAYVKLWKHHGAKRQAARLEAVAKERNEAFLDYYGGRISDEMLLPKVYEILEDAPKVYACAARFVEAADWIVWQLTEREVRSINLLGYKAFYHHSLGVPSKDYLKAVDARLEGFFEEKQTARMCALGECAGHLTATIAQRLGLDAGMPVSVGMIDAHAGMLGGGVCRTGDMMIVMGTSICHHVLAEEEIAIDGICGVVKDGILPGYFAYEAGQSGGGDHFAWFIQNCLPHDYALEAEARGISPYHLLEEKLEGYRAGQSGLLSLDWFNGVRTPLMRSTLSGMTVGLTLQTKPEELYLSLIEATAYSTRRIIELLTEAGLKLQRVLLSGGIAQKSPMIVQIYADVLGLPLTVCVAQNACARGAAILGALAAGCEVSGYESLKDAVTHLGSTTGKTVYPREHNTKLYDLLYQEYKNLSRIFGAETDGAMQRLRSYQNVAIKT